MELEMAGMSDAEPIQPSAVDAAVEKTEEPSTGTPGNPDSPVQSLPELMEPLQIRPDEGYPLVLDHTHRIAAESFGILRARVLRAQAARGLRSILLTSPGTEEGKTLISVNLGLSFGHLAQKRVLLVDGDLRASGATAMLKLGGKPGFADYLQGKRTAEEVIYPTSFPFLSVLPAGHVEEESLAELLAGAGWRHLLDFARQKYDLILVDSVPLAAPVVDLELLAAPCDGILLIIQIRKSARSALGLVRKRLDQQKILGVVINNADQLSGYSYSYYRYYGSKSK
jgi:capsular exopolysaccharide synthesis family protein